MRYLCWVISLVLATTFYLTYRTQYLPLKIDVDRLEEEIKMWENVLKGEKGIIGDRDRFTTERFFEKDKLTPYAEVEILRKFDTHYKGLELYISAPRAFKRAKDVLRFLSDQRITYKKLYCIVVIDSIEKFEYKFTK